MKDKEKTRGAKVVKTGGLGGLWFMGFIGALVYYVQLHSGTFWLVVLALIKAAVWPGLLVYHLLLFLKM